MKDSGLPWLGTMPEHWDLLRNRALMRRRKVLVGERHTAYRLLSLTKEGVIVRDVESGKGKFSADMGTSQEVRKGDLIFCLFDVPETPRTVGLSRHDGMITGAYTVFACPDPTLAGFLDLFYRAMDDRKLLSPLYSGLRNTIPPPRFMGIRTPVPPPPEQAAIVRFLDHVDRRMRRFIRTKQKVIKLLEEEKQAIIHRAVTRGLDPNVRLKHSGVSWLGDLPEHWKVRRAKYLFREVDHRSATGTEVLLSLRMYQGLVPHDEVSMVPIPAQALVGFKKIKPGQIVMNRMRAAIGMFGLAGRSGLVSPDYAVFDTNEDVEASYFLRLFRTPLAGAVFRIESKGLGTGSSGFMRLYTDRFGTIKLPVPPREEQQSLVQSIAEGTQHIDRTQERIRCEITLCQEYRTRLVADVVTGKLDVREAAARLPDEAAQPEPLGDADEVADAVENGGDDGVRPEEVEA
jgi:type I restriction enzyme S subunit